MKKWSPVERKARVLALVALREESPSSGERQKPKKISTWKLCSHPQTFKKRKVKKDIVPPPRAPPTSQLSPSDSNLIEDTALRANRMAQESRDAPAGEPSQRPMRGLESGGSASKPRASSGLEGRSSSSIAAAASHLPRPLPGKVSRFPRLPIPMLDLNSDPSHSPPSKRGRAAPGRERERARTPRVCFAVVVGVFSFNEERRRPPQISSLFSLLFFSFKPLMSSTSPFVFPFPPSSSTPAYRRKQKNKPKQGATNPRRPSPPLPPPLPLPPPPLPPTTPPRPSRRSRPWRRRAGTATGARRSPPRRWPSGGGEGSSSSSRGAGGRANHPAGPPLEGRSLRRQQRGAAALLSLLPLSLPPTPQLLSRPCLRSRGERRRRLRSQLLLLLQQLLPVLRRRPRRPRRCRSSSLPCSLPPWQQQQLRGHRQRRRRQHQQQRRKQQQQQQQPLLRPRLPQ